MPDGDDAESIAAQAVIDFLQQRPTQLLPLLLLAARQARRGLGRAGHAPNNPSIHHPASPAPLIQQSNNPTIHHPVLLAQQSNNPSIQQSSNRLLPRPISSSLSRLVWRHADRLHHRSENLLLRNAADLAPAYIDDGEVCRFIETIPDPEGNPYDNLVHKETTAEFEVCPQH